MLLLHRGGLSITLSLSNDKTGMRTVCYPLDCLRLDGFQFSPKLPFQLFLTQMGDLRPDGSSSGFPYLVQVSLLVV